MTAADVSAAIDWQVQIESFIRWNPFQQHWKKNTYKEWRIYKCHFSVHFTPYNKAINSLKEKVLHLFKALLWIKIGGKMLNSLIKLRERVYYLKWNVYTSSDNMCFLFYYSMVLQLGLTSSLCYQTHQRHRSLIISRWNGIRRILFSSLTWSRSKQADSQHPLRMSGLQLAVLVSNSELQSAICVKITGGIVSAPKGEKPQACRECQAASCAAGKSAKLIASTPWILNVQFMTGGKMKGFRCDAQTSWRKYQGHMAGRTVE